MDDLLKYWPVLVVVVGIVLAIGRTSEKVKVLEEKVKELFRLWNAKD